MRRNDEGAYTVVRPATEVDVVPERHADEIADRVMSFLCYLGVVITRLCSPLLSSLSLFDNIKTMIENSGNRLAEDLFYARTSKEARGFSPEVKRAARRKLLYLHDAAEIADLRAPPGNRLEALKGRLAEYYSIRINDQWRIRFRWQGGNAKDVQIVDYH